MAISQTTTNYSGRQLDILVAQGAVTLGSENAVQLSITGEPPAKFVAGIQKAIQRYLNCVLTVLGSVTYDSTYGTDFFSSLIANGSALNEPQTAFSIMQDATNKALNVMHEDDANTTLYGDIPSDEYISEVEVTDCQPDLDTGTLSYTLTVTFAAGTTVTFVLPAITITG